ncbi:MAG: Fur family transcriptional regulator [Patescibacteria group bacterium]
MSKAAVLEGDLKLLMRKSGYRATPARLRLAALLSREAKPMSIQGIERAFGGKKADVVTLYRTLFAFEKAGFVRQVDLRHGHAHYEWAHERTHHHHLVCTRCGVTEEYDGCEFAAFSKKALKKSKQFARIEDHASELFGICTRCDVSTS